MFIISPQQVADLIGADPREIFFTRHDKYVLLTPDWLIHTRSGATESNNLALKGIARFYKSKKNHIITVQTVCNLGDHIHAASTSPTGA